MCIYKNDEHPEHSTCCCGCSLFAATMLIGCFEVVSAAGSGMHENWVGLVLTALQCLFFTLVAVKRNCVTRWRLLHYCYLTLSVGWTILFVVAIVVLCVTSIAEPKFEQICQGNPDLYPGGFKKLDHCVDYLHKWFIAALSVIFLIFVPVRFAMSRVIWHGYLGQKALHERRLVDGHHEHLVHGDDDPPHHDH